MKSSTSSKRRLAVMSSSYFFWKRIFDIFSSFSLFVVIFPFLALLFLFQFVYYKGHPFYNDQRVGKNGKMFWLIKFRSMPVDANTNPERYLNDDQMKQWQEERKVSNDPRITKFGRFMRKTSLDELPQLFNIFIGQMSVVGTRAVTQDEIDNNYDFNDKMVILSAKPGLTGYWQVYGRGTATYENKERQQMEMEYFYHRSLLFDLKLIFLTIPAVLSHRGAN